MRNLITRLLLLLAFMMPVEAAAYVNGDVNCDDEVNIADINLVLCVIFGGDDSPYNNYLQRADVNKDGEVNIADVNALTEIIIKQEFYADKYVDLGLPSRALWATMNVGASCPEDYGDYFAWGETIPKDSYGWSTYKWCEGTDLTLTKYCTDSDYGTVDRKYVLDPEDDAAHVRWGSPWRMPTVEEQRELINNCTREWMSYNGVYGLMLTGPNGNKLFLPAAGYCKANFTANQSTEGFYWSRSIGSNSVVASHIFISSRDFYSYNNPRYLGFSVRAVRYKPDW